MGCIVYHDRVRVWYLLYLWNGKVGCLGGKPRFLSLTRKDDCGEKERLGDAPHVKQSAGHTEPWEKPTALKLSNWKAKSNQVSEQCQPKSGICNCVNQLLVVAFYLRAFAMGSNSVTLPRPMSSWTLSICPVSWLKTSSYSIYAIYVYIFAMGCPTRCHFQWHWEHRVMSAG